MRRLLLVFGFVGAGTTVVAQTARAQTAMPGAQSARQVPTHVLIAPPRSPMAPPLGISVQMQSATVLGPVGGAQAGGLGTAPFSLNMASSVALTAAANAQYGSSNNVQMTFGNPNFPGNGTIQFAPGNALASWLMFAWTRNSSFTLTINNTTSQGTWVYTLKDAQVTGGSTGPDSTAVVSIKYNGLTWTAPGTAGTFIGR